jgi:hypothetical protein
MAVHSSDDVGEGSSRVAEAPVDDDVVVDEIIGCELALASLCGTRINSIEPPHRGAALYYPDVESMSQ